MGRRDNLIAETVEVLRDRCGMSPDAALVGAVVDSCGPAVYGAGAASVDPSNPADIATLRRNFLGAKLDLPDGPHLGEAVAAAVEVFGPAEGEVISKPVLYYLLVVQLGRQDQLGL